MTALRGAAHVAGRAPADKGYAFDLIVTAALGSTFANGVISRDISIAQAVSGFVMLVTLPYAALGRREADSTHAETDAAPQGAAH